MKSIQTILIEIPGYALGYLSETEILVAGGGGNVKSGVPNQFRIYSLVKKGLFELETTYTLSTKDTPMSLTIDPSNKTLIVGVNDLNTKLAVKKNNHLHIFKYNKDKKTISISKSISIFPQSSIDSWDNYQRITRFNHSRTFLAIASANGYLALLKYPSLKPITSVMFIEPMVIDLDFSPNDSKLVYVSLLKLYTFVFSTKRQIHIQSLKEGTFRAVRWINENSLITIIHQQKQPPLLQRWEANFTNENQIHTERTLWIQTNACFLHKTSRAVTCMEMARTKQWAIIACADFSIIIIDIYTLKVLQKKSKMHMFPITALTISPNETQVLSVSVDARLQVIDICNKGGLTVTIFFTFSVIIAIILGAISIIYSVFNQKLF
ncbi:hypothetical protein PCK1_001525 [Pneumocystis canis]|nr:hypothetical protein PCK1_001525 [Pneumocystis canis]